MLTYSKPPQTSKKGINRCNLKERPINNGLTYVVFDKVLKETPKAILLEKSGIWLPKSGIEAMQYTINVGVIRFHINAEYLKKY